MHVICNRPQVSRILHVIFFLLLASPSILLAQLQILPSVMFVNEPSTSTQCVIRNPSDQQIEAWIDFRYGFPIMDDTGKVTMVYPDSLTQDERSAVPWMRAFPQRFVLGPQGSQVVRLIVQPPTDLSPGEYSARVAVEEKRSRPVSLKSERNDVRGTVEIVSRVDVPFHYRRGRPTTGIVVRDPNAVVEQPNLRVNALLTRTGNASFWGKAKLRLIGRADKVVASQERNIVVYNDIQFITRLDISKVPPGVYSLEFSITTDRTDVKREYVLQSGAYATTMEVTIR